MFQLRRDVPLAPLTTLGLGGPAREYLEAHDQGALTDALSDADAQGLPVLLLGGGSNLVVADEGFPGRVVKVGLRGVTFEPDGDRVLVHAAAGEVWDDLVARAVSEGLSGLEGLSGIPGSVGATPIQNVGAYGQEVGDTLTEVTLWDRVARARVTFDRARCRFSYRESVFKREARGRYAVLGVTLSLSREPPAPTRYGELSQALSRRGCAAPTAGDVRESVLTLRRGKAMVLDPRDPDTRSVGSFFVNPVVASEHVARVEAAARALGRLPEGERVPAFSVGEGRVRLSAGWLIERAGIAKGTALGGVAVSSRHALALVHRGGGSARALVTLGARVRETVRAVFGVNLEPEPMFAGFPEGDPLAAITPGA